MSTWFDRSGFHVHGETADEALRNLRRARKDDITVAVVNTVLNDLIRQRDRDRTDGPMLYMGWYWRNVDFFSPGGFTIAKGDGQTAACMNNKWGYPQRDLTDDEQKVVRDLVWDAYLTSHRGGNLAEIDAATDDKLAEAQAFIDGLDVPGEGW